MFLDNRKQIEKNTGQNNDRFRKMHIETGYNLH